MLHDQEQMITQAKWIQMQRCQVLEAVNSEKLGETDDFHSHVAVSASLVWYSDLRNVWQKVYFFLSG